MLFRYRAYDVQGRAVNGVAEARTSGEALSKIGALGLSPYAVEPATRPLAGGWLSMDITARGLGLADRARTVRLLAALLKAGVTIDKALKLLEMQAPGRKAKALVSAVSESVASGKTLSSALQAPGCGFAPDETGLVKAGEQTGNLPAVLEDLGAMLERRMELRGRLLSALVYPALLLVMALVSLVVIGMVLIPAIAPLLEQSGQEMPLIVRIMAGLGPAMRDNGVMVAIGLALAAILAAVLLRQPGARRSVERAALNVPFYGPIARLMESARICRTLGTLLRCGVAMQGALAATGEAARRHTSRLELKAAADNVSNGARLSDALRGLAVLNPSARQMVAIGEETNKLDGMLLHVAGAEEAEAGARIERAMALLTPLMTIALGLMIGGLIMSVMGAILSINDLAVS